MQITTKHDFPGTMTVVSAKDGNEFLFSYSTPVAGFVSGVGWFQTSQRYSRTTSAHIGRYARAVGLHSDSSKRSRFTEAEIRELISLQVW